MANDLYSQIANSKRLKPSRTPWIFCPECNDCRRVTGVHYMDWRMAASVLECGHYV